MFYVNFRDITVSVSKGHTDQTSVDIQCGSTEPQLPIPVQREPKNFLKRILKGNDKKRSLSGSSVDGNFTDLFKQ